MPTTDLLCHTILVTRPEHQAEPLCNLIEQAGGKTLRLPLLDIHDTSDTPAVNAALSQLQDYHLAIFISPNAVHFGFNAIEHGGGLPGEIKLAAIGASSARLLEQRAGRAADFVPSERFDSEGLLALLTTEQLEGKRILIFRGNGGREHLADTLRRRGAHVDYAEVYRRDCPPPLTEEDDRLDKADIIVITSSEALQNLRAITPASQQRLLYAKPLLLVSERTAQQARQMGFNNKCLVSQSNSETIVATLRHWAQQHQSME